MKLRITKSFCLERGRDVFPGDIVDVTPYQAYRIIALGRGVEITEDEPERKGPVPGERSTPAMRVKQR